MLKAIVRKYAKGAKVRPDTQRSAARTLDAKGLALLRRGRLRADCWPRQEERGPVPAPCSLQASALYRAPGGCSPTLSRLQEELRAARGAGQDRAQGSCPRTRLFCCLISRRRRRRRASSRRRSRHRRLCRPRLQSARTACRAGRVKTATFAGPLRSAFQHTARLGLCSAHSLHQRAHAIAAASALKSRLLAAPGGKGPHIRPPKTILSRRPGWKGDLCVERTGAALSGDELIRAQ